MFSFSSSSPCHFFCGFYGNNPNRYRDGLCLCISMMRVLKRMHLKCGGSWVANEPLPLLCLSNLKVLGAFPVRHSYCCLNSLSLSLLQLQHPTHLQARRSHQVESQAIRVSKLVPVSSSSKHHKPSKFVEITLFALIDCISRA